MFTVGYIPIHWQERLLFLLRKTVKIVLSELNTSLGKTYISISLTAVAIIVLSEGNYFLQYTFES